MNKVIFTGNLGKDPESRYTPSGAQVTSFSVAVTQTWTDASGEKKKKTDWVRVSAWGKLAEVCNQYLKKGSKVLVDGRLESPWAFVDDGGKAQANNQVTANEVEFLSPKSQNDTSSAVDSVSFLDIDPF